VLAAAAEWIRREFGLRLFGFDIVVDASTGVHIKALIDIASLSRSICDSAPMPM
jgi:hypothetical protein